MGNSTSTNDPEVADTTIKTSEGVRFVVMTTYDVLCSPAHSVDLSIDGTQTLESSASLLWTAKSRTTNDVHGSNISSELCSSITQESSDSTNSQTTNRSEVSTINFNRRPSTSFENMNPWSRLVQQQEKSSLDSKPDVPSIMLNANRNQHPVTSSTFKSPQKPCFQHQKAYRRLRWCGCC
ncbi:hypothetical protein M3Y94_00255800 [Aphelenchoides besseyi]|nr:hypothetical protein M3Y94_00255800 [Aphelenchoides besseyi]KAI6236221.1 hypothetical protein M3Y95_00134600 [Aphelenchoides besseyi]